MRLKNQHQFMIPAIAVRIITAFIVIVLSNNTSFSQVFDCEELRPLRNLEKSSEGNIELGANIISSRLLEGLASTDGNFQYKERFPDLFSQSSIPQIERFYYMVCLALSDERIDPERRFTLFLQAERERAETIQNRVDTTLSKGTPEEKGDVLEYQVSKGGDEAISAIRQGLESSETILKDAAITAIFANKKIVSGVIYGITKSDNSSFSIIINSIERGAFGLSMSGLLSGAAFEASSENLQFNGTVSGGNISITSEDCDMTAWQVDGSVFEGTVSCKTPFSYNRNKYRSRSIWMNLL